MSEDREIRKKLQEKDKDLTKQLQQRMQEEEEYLKQYFSQFKKPVSDDPTVVRSNASNDQKQKVDLQSLSREVMKPFQLFGLFYKFWNMELNTPQERETHRSCKKYILRQITLGTTVSLLVTSLVSCNKNRYILSPKSHMLGVFTGIMSGILFGLVSSTENTLKSYQKLGDKYYLGRVAMEDVERYRMDNKV